MYIVLLIVHSWIRWAAVVAGLGATIVTLTGRQTVGQPDSSDKWGLAFLVSMDLQLLIGLLLYLVVSPNMQAIRADFAGSMQNPVTRFWAVEHIGTMMVAIVMVHVGRVLGRKAPTPGAKHTRVLVCFMIATIAMLAATPWPGMAGGRPLFRYN